MVYKYLIRSQICSQEDVILYFIYFIYVEVYVYLSVYTDDNYIE